MTIVEMVEFIMDQQADLSGWEEDFIDDMYYKEEDEFSELQAEKIEQIYRKFYGE